MAKRIQVHHLAMDIFMLKVVAQAGGSVNIFYNNISSDNLDENLIIDVLGQGTGGNGTYNMGNISSGKYESLKASN